MIQFTRGDILKADAEALVNTVNCVGVMGRGVALQFKDAFPANFKAYAAACRRGEVEPGRMFVFDTGDLTPPRYIINFPTKRHWRGKSRIEDIEAGLVALVEEVRARGIRSLAIPPLGSGLGGLGWGAVRALIERALEALPDVEALVFEPGGAPADARANRSSDETQLALDLRLFGAGSPGGRLPRREVRRARVATPRRSRARAHASTASTPRGTAAGGTRSPRVGW